MKKTAEAYPGYPGCRHIKTDGERCGSPALSGRNFCYYHTLYRQRNKPNKKTPSTLHAPMVDAENHWHSIEVMDPFREQRFDQLRYRAS